MAGPQLSGFTVVTAPGGSAIARLTNGYDYDIRESLSVRADPMWDVGSVTFRLDDKQLRTENFAPYSAGGDISGHYAAWKPTIGSHTLVATPYSADNAQGVAGSSIAVTFNVVNSRGTPTPTPNPTPTPTVPPTPTPTPSGTPRPSPTPVTSVTLAWNGSSSSGIAGYHVSYGTVSHTYTQRVDAGNRTSTVISGLTSNKTYYFAVSAYNATGAESALSNEVSFSTGSGSSSSSTPTPAATATPTPSSTPRQGATPPPSVPWTSPRNPNAPFLQNLSSRVRVGDLNNVDIVGFTIGGSGQKTVIVRALGPSLARFGVKGLLSDPVLQIHNSVGDVIASNDNWRDLQEAGFGPAGPYHAFEPGTNSESALAINLSPGSYTVTVSGKNGSQGVGLAEIYDFSQDTGSTLINVSTRAQVLTGEDVLIGGVTVRGSSSLEVVLRAVGPTLARYGVTNSLQNPLMALYNSNGMPLGSSDSWQSNVSQANQLISSGYAPADAREPAMIVLLPPGSYTAVVRGKNDTTGIALFDAYMLMR